MKDTQIIEMYWHRDEDAIRQTDLQYGAYCRHIAMNVLSIHEDAEECVNDSYLHTWNSIPPCRPFSLRAWLGKAVRNTAINLWKRNHAQKRYSGMDLMLSELEECLPAAESVESAFDARELGRMLSGWLRDLPEEDRNVFVRRYWYGEAVKELAEELQIPVNRLTQRMFRLRQNLKAYLEKEGVVV